MGVRRKIRRGGRSLWLLAPAIVIVAASFYWYLEARTIGARCGGEPPAATSGYRHEWRWVPFAYECIYTDERGRTVARHRPERPHVRHLR